MYEKSSVMESRDFVSVLRPIFASLGLEGFRSRLDTLTIAKKCYSKIFIIQQFLFAVFAGKKQRKQFGKMPEI